MRNDVDRRIRKTFIELCCINIYNNIGLAISRVRLTCVVFIGKVLFVFYIVKYFKSY